MRTAFNGPVRTATVPSAIGSGLGQIDSILTHFSLYFVIQALVGWEEQRETFTSQLLLPEWYPGGAYHKPACCKLRLNPGADASDVSFLTFQFRFTQSPTVSCVMHQ